MSIKNIVDLNGQLPSPLLSLGVNDVNAHTLTMPALNVATSLPTSIGTPLGVDVSNNLVKLSESSTPLPQSLKTVNAKAVNFPVGSYINAASYTGSSGKLRKLWFASLANPDHVFMRIKFDGVTTVGTDITSGFTPSNSLSISVLLSGILGGTDATSDGYWSTNYSGCSTSNVTGMGGYLSFDNAFFNTSFEVDVFNTDGGSGPFAFWCQAFYSNEPVTSPLRLHISPFDFATPISYVLTSYEEWCLLYIPTGSNVNGAYIAGCKMCFINYTTTPTPNARWIEGRHNIYSGVVGANVNNFVVYFATTATNATYWNAIPGVSTLFNSTGTEDFFLNSYGFAHQQLYSCDEAGCIWNPSGPTSNIVAYRMFPNPTGANAACPGVPAGQSLTFTWTIGNQIADAGSVSPPNAALQEVLGYVIYYV